MQFIPSVSCVDGVFHVDVLVRHDDDYREEFESLGEFRTGLTEFPNDFEQMEVILLVGKMYFKNKTFSVLREYDGEWRTWERDVKGEKLICEILMDGNNILRFVSN